MAKQKDYSAEAIQARQKLALDEYNRTQAEQKKPVRPEPAPVTEIRPQFAVPRIVVPKATPTPPKPGELPFLAKDVDKYGNPFYGEGLKGWALKTFAHVFNPKNFEIDKQVKAEYDAHLDARTERYNEITRWDEWGAQIFGISARQLQEGFTTAAAAVETSKKKMESGETTKTDYVGEVAQTGFGIASRTVLGNIQGAGSIMGGLQLLGLDDVAVRKVTSTFLATETLGKQDEIKNPGILSSMKYALFGSHVPGVVENYVNGRITRDDIEETYKNYWKGSQAAYSMVHDQQVQDEFDRQVAAGRDPELVAQNVGNPYIELAGSIFLSPSTYLGAPIPAKVGKFLDIAPEAGKFLGFFGKLRPVYRIPSGAELLRLSVGQVARRAVANRLDDVSHIPGFEDAFRRFGNVADEAGAKAVVDEATSLVSRAVKIAQGKVDDLSTAVSKGSKSFLKGTFGLVSYTDASKVSVTNREMKTVMDVILKDAESVDDAISVYRDMARVAKNPDDKAAIARLLKFGKTPFSESGLMTGQVLAKMGDVIEPIMKKLARGTINAKEIADDLFGGVSRVVDDLLPSVEDMARANRAVKSGKYTPRQAELAKLYESVPAYAKTTSALHQYTNKARMLGVNIMSNVFMNLMPSYFSKNILGQSFNIVPELGLAAALEITAKSYKGIDGVVGSRKWTNAILDQNAKALEKLLDFVPEGARRGIGNAMGEIQDRAGKWGYLSAGQNAELIASSEIVLRAARNEVMKALPALIKTSGWDELAKALPKEQSNLLAKLLTDNFGNWNDSIDEFRKIVGKGEIEAWRLTEIPPQLMRTLDDLHQGDILRTLMKTAKTQDEFAAGVKKIIDTLDEQAKNVFKEAQTVGGMSPEAVKNLVVEISPKYFGEGSELFNRKVVYWENAQTQLVVAVSNARESIGRKLKDLGDPQAEAEWKVAKETIDAIQKTHITFADEMHAITDIALDIYHAKKVPFSELADRAVYGNRWSLRQEYPNLDWDSLTQVEFNDVLWRSAKEAVSNGWNTWNMNSFDGQMDVLENFTAKIFKVPLDAAVTKYSGEDNPFRLAFEYRKIAKELSDIEAGKVATEIKDVVELAAKYGIRKQAILNTVNKHANNLDKEFDDVSKIPPEVAKAAFEARRIKRGDPDPFIPHPAAYNGEQPTFARALWESMPGIRRHLNTVQESVISEWGKVVKTADVGVEEALAKYSVKYKEGLKVVKTKAGLFGNALRDYILHDYEKTNLDLAMSYLMPFQYWTTRTYARWMERFVENPRYANWYLNYKEFLAKEHSELPEWWRYNVKIPSLPGINNDPIFMNLEATVNPLNGLLGTDFNDPYKRVDWVSRLVDDMNKAGPSLAPIYSWAVAIYLYNKGEADAGDRWMGRMFPQSSIIKTMLNKMGANLNLGPFVKNNETDPFVNFLMDGLDPYERNRVARNLAGFVNKEVMINGEMVRVTPEMAIEASAKQEGDLWEYAIQSAISEREVGQTFSFLFGVGFKTRNEGDLEVDRFYGEYHKLLAARSMMSPEDYKNAWNGLREDFPFMDTLLIGKKSGDDRDTAYAYNILSRIPPGELSDMAEITGINSEMLEKFYDNKGDFSTMTESDRDRFMAAIVDMSLMLKLPSYSTQEEWNYANAVRNDMNATMAELFGEDIQSDIDKYYRLSSEEKKIYLETFPNVEAALRYKDAYVTNTPILSAYYGGLDTVERFYTNQMYDQLEEEFGEDITDLYAQYNALRDNLMTAEAKAFYNANNLKAYETRKKELQAEADKLIIQAGRAIPEGQGYEIRPEFQPVSQYQEEALGVATTDVQAQQAEAIWNALSPAAQELVTEHFQTGEKIPSSVMRQLDYIAGKYGMNQYDALRLLGVETP